VVVFSETIGAGAPVRKQPLFAAGVQIKFYTVWSKGASLSCEFRRAGASIKPMSINVKPFCDHWCK